MWSGKIEPFADPNIIPLELVVVSDVTDIKASRPKPDKPEPETVTEPEPVPEVVPEPTPEEPKPEPDKSTELAAPSEHDDAAEPAEETLRAFDLDALAKGFEDMRKDNPDETQQVLGNENQTAQIADNARASVGAGTDNTANAVDYIRSHMHNCWFVDTGAVDYQNLKIKVKLVLDRYGDILDITVLNDAEIIASPNRSWGVARHNATTALRKCAPYDGLLTTDYDVWKELILHLDPGED